MGKWKKLLFLVLLLEMSFLIMSPVSTVTAKLYGLRMKRVQNANSEGPLPDPETIKLLLEQAIQHDGILTPGLKVTGMYASKQNENWSDGYCLTFSRSSDGGYFGKSCYYLDGLDLHPGIERLNQYHFSYQSLEFQPQELIKFNTMYRLYENPQTDERFIRGAFVRGSWIGDYTLNVSSSPETDFHNMIQTMNNIFDQIPWNVNGNDGELLFTATTRAIQRYIDRGELTLPNEYELTNIHLEESWSGAEIMNCFNFDLHIDYPGQFCFFRDNATDLTTQQRLFNLTHFANPYRQNEVMEGLSNLGEASLGITYFDFDQRAYTRADFVEGDWLVQVSMPIMESEEETVAILSDIANRIIKILDDLPANLEMNLSNIPYAQTLDYGLKQQNMPDGYQISPLVRCNGWEYFPAQYIFQNNELTTNYSIRYKYVADWLNLVSETEHYDIKHNAQFIENFNYDPQILLPVLSDRNAFARLEMDNYYYLAYNLEKDGLVAELNLPKEEESWEIGLYLVQALKQQLNNSTLSHYPMRDTGEEAKIWGCFPNQNELQINTFMESYNRYIVYTPKGYVYWMMYIAPGQPVDSASVSVQPYLLPPDGWTLPVSTSRIDDGNDKATKLYYNFELFGENSSNLQFSVTSLQSQNLVRVFTNAVEWNRYGGMALDGYLNDSADTQVKDAYIHVAEQVQDCLENQSVMISIKAPGDLKALVDESYIYSFSIYDDKNDWLASGNVLSETRDEFFLNTTNYQEHGITLEFWLNRQLNAPLTYVIYNPTYDFVTYKKEDKLTLPGDYVQSTLRLERIQMLAGENELQIWMGDTLIGRYKITNFWRPQDS